MLEYYRETDTSKLVGRCKEDDKSGGMKMNRWQVIFEVTLDIKDGESKESALQRAKMLMGTLFIDDGIAHYHVLQQPKIVVEFD